MRTVPIELLAQFRKGFFSLRHLFKFELTSRTIRWTDADSPIYANVEGSSYWYNPKGIKFESAKYDLLPTVDYLPLEIDNADRKMTRLVLSEDIRNRAFTMWRVAVDRNMDVQGFVLIFYGFIDTQDPIDEKVAHIQIANHMIKWRDKTLGTYSPTCMWPFMSENHCDYVGAGDVTTAIRVQANEGATAIEVDSTSGMNTIDSKISIVLDNGTKHWSKITEITDADTLVIADGIPSGRYAPVDAAVQTMRWCDHSWKRCTEMSNQKNFRGFRWLQYLEDKSFWWGRAPK
jgi:hypothetical protein